MGDAALENLRLCNPAARCLPLFALLASGKPGTIMLNGAGDYSLKLDLDLL